jgi:hypothetical protein
MTDRDPAEAIRQAWQASAADPQLPGDEALRGAAEIFYRKLRRRNAIEYAAAVLVLIIFSAYALFLPSPAARIGAVLVVLGTLVMLWQLNRRASALPTPDRQAERPILHHQRDQLARQRDALASVFTWYLLPFIPGMAVMIFSGPLDHGIGALTRLGSAEWIALAFCTGVFTGVWWLNRRMARKIQKQLDEIEALIGEAG